MGCCACVARCARRALPVSECGPPVSDRGLARGRTLEPSERTRAGEWRTLEPGERITTYWDRASLEAAVGEHKRNLWIPWTEVTAARLHEGSTTDRLLVERRGRSRVRLLWLTQDPASELLRPALRKHVGAKFSED
jgi:hypothetical protein